MLSTCPHFVRYCNEAFQLDSALPVMIKLTLDHNRKIDLSWSADQSVSLFLKTNLLWLYPTKN